MRRTSVIGVVAALGVALLVGGTAWAKGKPGGGGGGGKSDKPTGLAASIAAPHYVALSWDASADPAVTGYNVYRNTSFKGRYSLLAGSPTPDTSFLDVDVAVGETYYYKVSALTAGGAESSTSDAVSIVVVEVDGTPPVIFDVHVTDITSTSAIIRWDTDEPADSLVEYGLDPALGSASDLDGAEVLSHAVLLDGLVAGSTYFYRVHSVDASGNAAASADLMFATAGAGGACAECHDPLPQAATFLDAGHGRDGVDLTCEACHYSGYEHQGTYKELKPVAGVAYPDAAVDPELAVIGRESFCVDACHLPLSAGNHPTGYFESSYLGAMTYAEVLTPQGFIDKYGFDMNIDLPGAVLPLLDFDGSGTQSFGDVVMCGTCHDPHGGATSTAMLRISTYGSELCVECHNQ